MMRRTDAEQIAGTVQRALRHRIRTLTPPLREGPVVHLHAHDDSRFEISVRKVAEESAAWATAAQHLAHGSPFGSAHEGKAWRPLETAHRDGRPLILCPRDWEDFEGIARWDGGVAARWWTGEGRWWVITDPTTLDEGSGEHVDSIYFVGWCPLPDELYEKLSGPDDA